MADISRIASPMSLCEEDLFDVDKSVEKKKEELKQLQKKPASFFIGSIDVINEKISNLNQQLSAYESKLAIESQSSCHAELSSWNKRKTPKRLTRSACARDEKDAKNFEEVVSQESVFTTGEKSIKKRIFSKKSDEPQLVELQQYPGFDPTIATPLPHSLEVKGILDIVVKAQNDLKRKPTYKRDFDKMFYSKQQKTILQDTFWWYFLHKLHPNPQIESKLFKRIARNYADIFLMSVTPRYKNVFLTSYGNLLAQAVYCSFCHAFPQSWRQFDELDFKDDLLGTCISWVSGIQPRPGIHRKWNYSGLEPGGMRKDESISNDKNEANDLLIGFHSTASENSTSSLSRELNTRSKSIPKSLSKAGSNRSRLLSGVSSLKSKSHEMDDQQPNETLKREELAAARQNRQKPPYFRIRSYAPVNAETYDDVVKAASEKVRRIGIGFRKVNSDFVRDSQVFDQKMKEDKNEYEKKTSKLLSKPRRVGRLSTMIMMDLKRTKEDATSAPVGVSAALQAALSAE